jgi:hypothetical protein
MSVCPAQKSSKPAPVPGPFTVIDTSGFRSRKNSATRLVTGWTVDEPDTRIEPERPLAASSSEPPPHAASISASDTAPARPRIASVPPLIPSLRSCGLRDDRRQPAWPKLGPEMNVG